MMRKNLLKLFTYLGRNGLASEAFAVNSLLKEARLDPEIESVDRGDGRICPNWSQQGFSPWAFIDQLINEYQEFIEQYNYQEWFGFLSSSGIEIAPWMDDAISWGMLNVSLLADEDHATVQSAGGGTGVATQVEFKATRSDDILSHLGFDTWIFDNEIACMSVDSLASLVAHEVAHVALAHTRNWVELRRQAWAQSIVRSQEAARKSGATVGVKEIPLMQPDGTYKMVDWRDIDELTLSSQDNEFEADLLGKALAEALGYRWGVYIQDIKDKHKEWDVNANVEYNEEILRERRALTDHVKSGGSAYSDDPECVKDVQFMLKFSNPDGVFGPGTFERWKEKVDWSSNEQFDVMVGLLPLDCEKANLMISRGELKSHPPEEFRGAAMNLANIKDDKAREIATSVVRVVEESKAEERRERLKEINDRLVARDTERSIFGDNLNSQDKDSV